MKGLRVYNKRIEKTNEPIKGYIYHPLKEGVSDLSVIIFPIIDKLSDYYWFIDKNALSVAIDASAQECDKDEWELIEEINSLIIKRFDSYFLAEKVFFQKYARYIIDDWADIFGLSNLDLDLNQLIGSQYLLPEEKNLYYSNNVTLYFSNVDMLYWEFYSKEDSLLHVVETGLQNRVDVSLEHCNLLNRLL